MGWITIPQWPENPVYNVFHREQELPSAGGEALPQNVHVLVRAVFDLPQGPCRLHVSADDYYHAWVNGKWLGCGPAPGYPTRYYYQTYPLSGGRRIVLALHVYYQGLINRVFISGDGRLGFFLHMENAGAAVEPVRLRCTLCHAYSGGIVGYDTQFLEDFDSRLWPEGWECPGFDDSGWEAPVAANWADYQMFPQPIKMLQWTLRRPVSLREDTKGLLLDFGEELTGMLSVRAFGRDGQRVLLRFGEELDAQGNVRFDMRCGCRYEECWILRAGDCRLHPFDYKAFRYVQLLPEPGVVLEEMALWQRHYPMAEEACTLKCSRDELEDIFRICKTAVRCGCQEGFLDCPSREKGQYLGDAIITARSQLWLTGSTELLRKCIRDFTESLSVSPGMLAVAPGSLMQEIADFSLLYPLLPLTDYEFTGDKEFLGECYPSVVSVIDSFASYARGDGLLENVSAQWNLVDWPETARDAYDFPLTRPVAGKGCHNVVNALWYGALLMREKIEKILGIPSERTASNVKNSYHNVFFRREQKLFADSEKSTHCSLHANLYAAFFGLLPSSSADAYEALLLTPGRFCGVLPMYFALRGLACLGKHRTLYRLLTRDDAHGWRNMLREGASACFEAWGKEQKWNTSLCHPWASAPISLIIEELAGFHPSPELPEGFFFEPKFENPPEDFRLVFPFRGERYWIAPGADHTLHLERMNADVASQNE